MLPDLDVLLPQVSVTETGETFVMLAGTDQRGAEVLARRIRKQLAESEELQAAGATRDVTYCLVDLPTLTDDQPIDERVKHVASYLEEIIKRTIDDRSPG